MTTRHQQDVSVKILPTAVGPYNSVGRTRTSRDTAHTTSYSTLIKTMRLYRFRDISTYLSQVVDFNPPHLYLLPYGVTPA